jgi:nucleotide-binding universal stress UspA family protein
MGQTILRIAEKRAEDSGMAAERVIREGKVGEEIARYLTESGATLLLLGAPRKEDLSRFGEDGIVRFAEWIQAATGVAVEVVRSRNAAA